MFFFYFRFYGLYPNVSKIDIFSKCLHYFSLLSGIAFFGTASSQFCFNAMYLLTIVIIIILNIVVLLRHVSYIIFFVKLKFGSGFVSVFALPLRKGDSEFLLLLHSCFIIWTLPPSSLRPRRDAEYSYFD